MSLYDSIFLYEEFILKRRFLSVNFKHLLYLSTYSYHNKYIRLYLINDLIFNFPCYGIIVNKS